jgi:hypothetical protein
LYQLKGQSTKFLFYPDWESSLIQNEKLEMEKKDGFTKKIAIILVRRTINGLISVLPFLVAKALHLGSKERSNTWIGPWY